MDITYDAIKQKVPAMHYHGQAYINGRYVDAKAGKTFACLNPATGKLLTNVAACDEHDIDVAVKSARKAFASWSETPPDVRKRILLRLADLIEENLFTLALMESLDTGKPIRDSLNGDIPGAIHCMRWYAELIDKVYDKIAPTAQSTLALITREPLGVIGGVTAWNFPFYLTCAKIAPALAAGNCIVIKPAEQAPLTTIYLGQLASSAGLPEGVLNIVPGIGEVAGYALGMHQDVDAISFTGSTDVGKLFLKYSADSNMKRIFLECGGKSPNVVLADCDLDKAAYAAAEGIFKNQGEVCCAPTRLLLQQSIKDTFLDKLIQASKAFHPGDPLDPQTLMGAIIDETQTKKILSYIESGKAEGAELVLGGKQVKQESGGCFIEPTIFTQVTQKMRIAREEIFGPVLSVASFNEVDEAIRLANDTHYGLAACVWTSNINHAHHIARSLRAGVVSVNCINGGDITTPFGGYKQSGIGRESGMAVLDHYTELKTTWINLN